MAKRTKTIVIPVKATLQVVDGRTVEVWDLDAEREAENAFWKKMAGRKGASQ